MNELTNTTKKDEKNNEITSKQTPNPPPPPSPTPTPSSPLFFSSSTQNINTKNFISTSFTPPSPPPPPKQPLSPPSPPSMFIPIPCGIFSHSSCNFPISLPTLIPILPPPPPPPPKNSLNYSQHPPPPPPPPPPPFSPSSQNANNNCENSSYDCSSVTPIPCGIFSLPSFNFPISLPTLPSFPPPPPQRRLGGWFGESSENHPGKREGLIAPFSLSVDQFEEAACHLWNLNLYLSSLSPLSLPSILRRYRAFLVILNDQIQINEEENKEQIDQIDQIYPPDREVHCVWISHVIRTDQYKRDLIKTFGRIIPSFLIKELSDQDFITKSNFTKNLIEMRFPNDHLFDDHFIGNKNNNFDERNLPEISLTIDDVIEDKNWLIYFKKTELKGSEIDPISSYYIREAIKDYERFLYLVFNEEKNEEKLNGKFNEGEKTKIVNANYKIDLIWHCHILNSINYEKDILKLIGRELDHDPWPILRSELENSQIKLHNRSLWLSEFSVPNFLNF